MDLDAGEAPGLHRSSPRGGRVHRGRTFRPSMPHADPPEALSLGIHRRRRPMSALEHLRRSAGLPSGQSGNISIPDVADQAPTPVADDARERDGGCDDSYFRAIRFGIVRHVATINCTPFTTSLEVTECGSSGFVPVPPMSSPGIKCTDTPCGRGAAPIIVPDPGLSLPLPDCRLPGIRSDTAMCRGVMSHNTFG